MNDSDKTIAETLYEDRKVNAQKEYTRRSNNDYDAMAPGEYLCDPMH